MFNYPRLALRRLLFSYHYFYNCNATDRPPKLFSSIPSAGGGYYTTGSDLPFPVLLFLALPFSFVRQAAIHRLLISLRLLPAIFICSLLVYLSTMNYCGMQSSKEVALTLVFDPSRLTPFFGSVSGSLTCLTEPKLRKKTKKEKAAGEPEKHTRTHTHTDTACVYSRTVL